MRISGTSKLDPLHEEICKLWKKTPIVAEVRRELAKRGFQVRDTTLAKWIDRRVASRELTPERSQYKTEAKVATTFQKSLGLLDSDGDEDRQAASRRILRILFEPDSAGNPETVKISVGPQGLGVPLINNCEPDFSAYARQLGRRRVHSLGDMDYILLAMWTQKFHEITQSQQVMGRNYARQRRELISLARKVRDEMFAAVGCR